MMRPSDDMNDLTSDIRHLSTLVGVITSMTIDIINPDRTIEDYRRAVNEVTDLLWIARDMVEQLVENGEACHDKVLAAARKVAV
jgi:hypothetical protein